MKTSRRATLRSRLRPGHAGVVSHWKEWATSTALVLAVVLVWTHAASAQDKKDAVIGATQNFWESIYDPNRPQYEAQLTNAENALRVGEREALEDAVSHLKALKPQAAPTLLYRAVLLEQRGDYGASLTLLKEAASLAREQRPDHLELIHFEMAMVLTRLGRYREAIEAYEVALATNLSGASRAVHLGNMAELTMALGDLDEAIKLYRKAMATRPNYVPGMLGMAVALERQGQRDSARGYLLQAMLAPQDLTTTLDPSNLFFAPPADRDFLMGLLAEEQGDWQGARRHLELYVEQSAQGRYLQAGRAALARVEGQRAPLAAVVSLKRYDLTAWAADPKGSAIALGDKHGEVVLLRGDRVLSSYRFERSQRVTALAFSSDDGTLLAARQDGHIDALDPRGLRRKSVLGPVRARRGNRVGHFSMGGQAMLVHRGSSQRWSLTTLAEPSKELRPVTLGGGARDVALGPWDDQRQDLVAAFWTHRGNLELHRAGPSSSRRTFRPPIPISTERVAMTPDGRHIILVGRERLLVCRVMDMRVVKTIKYPVESRRWRRALAAIYDEAGAAGHGPALLVFYKGRYVAWRQSALLPSRTDAP